LKCWVAILHAMPGVITCACAAAGAALALGAWKITGFVRRVRDYRESAKGAALAAPAGFCIEGATAARANDLQWFVIDDQVMGGRSSSALTMGATGEIEFAGVINTNGGGFSSCRTLGDDEPLGFPADTSHIEVTAIGDGRQYKLTLHTADSWSMSTPSWAHDFHTLPAGQERTWRLPLTSFVPLRQGKPVKGAVLDAKAITGVGINLSLYNMHGKSNSHFGDGPFRIILKKLTLIR